MVLQHLHSMTFFRQRPALLFKLSRCHVYFISCSLLVRQSFRWKNLRDKFPRCSLNKTPKAYLILGIKLTKVPEVYFSSSYNEFFCYSNSVTFEVKTNFYNDYWWVRALFYQANKLFLCFYILYIFYIFCDKILRSLTVKAARGSSSFAFITN